MEIKYYLGEIWKDIYYYDRKKKEWVDYRGYYQVNNFGRVRNYKTGKLLNEFEKNGYLFVSLSLKQKKRHFRIHRLVAYMFVPNLKNLMEVNHKDENKHNNICTNLEWCDRKYNCNYGTGQERRTAKRSTPILQYTPEGVFVKRWISGADADKFGFNHSLIFACCLGKRNKHKGFVWRYEKEEE